MINDLTGQITSGQLKPGDQLPTNNQLRKQYGVSITVVRAALQWLKARGLIEGVHGVGVFVTNIPEEPPSSG
ncbi:DNA-binding GntR family transcriptional regulator [Hamadaea flava]|uniref:Winged helix-turn-helix domain-containing protein n=1 Tax=Hamadaea flava TaxID=1742688 RepID=A0ABV8LFQ2_9ACTN|nr:winged helix-turn-helix domain-containing protein [Hamadaea flava]MCP2323419.1 DNA-binding GntR family transcriptional regulator [Hamadaea flava]